MTIAEGGGRRAVSSKLREMYFPTLKTSYLIWPLVQMVNFRLMPIQLQLVSPPPPVPPLSSRVVVFGANILQPFVSCVSIAWTAYLSLANSSDGA